MKVVPTKLGIKVMLWIAGSFMAIFIIMMNMIINAESKKSIDWTRDMAQAITKTVEKSMEQSMNQGDMEAIQAIMEDVAQVTDVVRLRVVNDKGVITRSSFKNEVGDVVSEAIIQEGLRSGGISSDLDRVTDGGRLRVVSPLVNSGTCVQCHNKIAAGSPLGLLDLTLSVRDKLETVNRTRWVLIWGGLAMVVFVSLNVFILLQWLILRHLSTLSHAAGLMAEGNTTVAVDIKTNDEIGLLGQAFNKMAVNINDAHEKNTSLIKGISDPLLTVDNELTVTFLNEPMESLLGFRKEEAQGKIRCQDLLHCSTCGNGCHLKRIVEGRETTSTEKMEISTRIGKKVPVVATNSVLRDSQGKIIGAISIVRDVTREKEAEQKLADEVSWSESVIRAIADPMFTVDKDKNITFINNAALALSGFSREEAMGQKCFRILKGEICRQNCIYDRSLREGQMVHGVERNLLPKSGAEILASASGSVLLSADNTGVGFLEIVRDVTEEQRHINNLVDILKHIQGASQTIISMSQQIVSNSEEQKKSVSEQSSSVKEVATTIEELDITSQQTAEKAENVVRVAQKTVQISQDGQKAVEENIELMNTIRNRVESIAEQILELSQQAQQIGSIITAVNDLAEQTNLLALNAAIEAARAGEHGRGFTVVAMEVKKLAEQSQAATAKIAALINEIQEATKTCVQVTEEGAKEVEEGVKFAATAGDTIQKAMNNIADTADAVQQIAAIAKQQSVGIQQVSIAMANINTGMNQTTQSAERLSEAAEHFNKLSGQLNDLVRKYKL